MQDETRSHVLDWQPPSRRLAVRGACLCGGTGAAHGHPPRGRSELRRFRLPGRQNSQISTIAGVKSQPASRPVTHEDLLKSYFVFIIIIAT